MLLVHKSWERYITLPAGHLRLSLSGDIRLGVFTAGSELVNAHCAGPEKKSTLWFEGTVLEGSIFTGHMMEGSQPSYLGPNRRSDEWVIESRIDT